MSDTSTIDSGVQERTKLKKPVPWTVVIYNDDYTPMDFVVAMLMHVFHLDLFTANEVMMKIHMEGHANVGSYSRDIAETKADYVVNLAQGEGHPLIAKAEQA